MTFDIEKMLREGATPAEINKAIAEATATAQQKIDAENAAKAKETTKTAKAKAAADALNDFLRFCDVCGPKEEVFTAKDLLDAVSTSKTTIKTVLDSPDFDKLLDDLYESLFPSKKKSSVFDKYKS